MYIHWKTLFSCGLAFWGLMCATDLLGDSSWKKCSPHVDDILRDHARMHQEDKNEAVDNLKIKTNWPMLLWNTCAFLFTLLFCSVLKSMSWFVWRLFRIYNIFRNRKVVTNKLLNSKMSEGGVVSKPTTSVAVSNPNCKVLFRNQMFVSSSQQESDLFKQLEELKRDKVELGQQLLVAKKENMTAKQQIEEYKLESLMMREKLTRTTDSLKENLKYKDFATANQEIIARKAQSLETHLKEVSKDRDLLKNKLSNLEKSYSKLTERLIQFEKERTESFCTQTPEKDISSNTQDLDSSEISRGDADVCTLQKLKACDSNLDKLNKLSFETNSKISVDLEESSKDNESEFLVESVSDFRKKSNIADIKKNILNYSAYKVAQMLKPRFKLTNFKRLYTSTDTTGSSSDENGGSCHRIISSTIEFQNFLKTLNSKSVSNVSCHKRSEY